jgi:hypothetical protein
MSPQFQTLAALVIVALAATWLVWRALAKKKSGCGGNCGCPSSAIKSKPRP